MRRNSIMRVTSHRAQKGQKIMRFNRIFDNFCSDVIEKTVADIIDDLHHEYVTKGHFEERKKQRKCLKISIKKIFTKGKVFAYELIDGKYLSRIAFRLDGVKLTHIYVIELTRDVSTGYIDYRYVTCYKKAMGHDFEVDPNVYYLGHNFYDQR